MFFFFLGFYFWVLMNLMEFDCLCCWDLELVWWVLVSFFVGLVKIVTLFSYWGC